MSDRTTTDALSFPFDGVPNAGEARNMLPGIRWIRQPLPFALDHVNCWLLDDSDAAGGCALIDTGVATDASRATLQAALSKASPAGVEPHTVLVTHFHPDHIGLAGEFVSRGARVVVHPEELALATRIRNVDDAEYGERYAEWYRSNGLGEGVVDKVRRAGNSYRTIVAEPPEAGVCELVVAGSDWQVGERHFRVLEGHGHAPHMLMLYDASEHLLIAADQILPTISPNVSRMPQTVDADPLASFLGSLSALRELPADTLVLPSHGRPFRGLHQRVDALLSHHEARLKQVYEACAESMTASALFPILFGRRSLDAQQLSFALGESISHLACLVARGELIASDEGGVVHYRHS